MLLTAFNPEILSILGNILIISKLTNLQSDVNVLLLLKLSIIVSISDVFFILFSIFKTSEYKHLSTKKLIVDLKLIVYLEKEEIDKIKRRKKKDLKIFFDKKAK